MKTNLAQQSLAKNIEALMNKGMSQSQLASLAAVTPSTVSEIRRHKRIFSDRLVKKVQEKIKVYSQGENLATEVRQYKRIWNIASATQKKASFSMVVGDSGLSKTSTLKSYAKAMPTVYYIKIDRRYTWNQLLQKIAAEMGVLDYEGKGKSRKIKRIWTSKILDRMLSHIEKLRETPLLIIDEAEELSPSVLRKFKSLYVATEDLLGILICGISSLEKKIARLAGLTPEWKYQKESNEYTTFARRLKRFTVPNISQSDWEKFLAHFGIKSQDIVQYALSHWWNYDHPHFLIKKAEEMGLEIASLSPQDLQKIA